MSTPQDALIASIDAEATDSGASDALPATEPASAPPDTPSAAADAPPVVETPAPLPPPAAAVEDVSPPPPPAPEHKVVPLASLLEERRAAKEREAALQAELERFRSKPAADPEKPLPDFQADPKGYVDQKEARAREALEQVRAQNEQQQAVLQRLELANNIKTAEQAFAAESPDWDRALAHLRSVRLRQLQVLDPEASQERLTQVIGQEELALASRELSAGRNPYATAYEMAKLVGYTAPRAESAAADTAAQTVEKLTAPKTPTKQLSPDATLSTVAGIAPGEAADDEPDDFGSILGAARSERFGRR
jgi:hypothetical protein